MMTENTTISRSKENSLLTSATEDEFVVAQILLDLPSMIGMRESGPGLEWGSKKRRSRVNDAPSNVEIQQRQTQPKATEEVAAAAAAAASPVTPLAFPPTESDEKSRHASKRSSRKRSREEYIGMIEELTQRRDLLREAIVNVSKYYNKLIAYNSELRAMKQQMLNSCLRKEEEAKVGKMGERSLETVLSQQHQPQPLAADQMAEKFQHSIGPIRSSHNGLGSSSPPNYVGPLGIPDLNISAEAAFLSDAFQPSDTIRDVTARRARFAEARRKRMDIIKIRSMRSTCGFKLPRTRY